MPRQFQVETSFPRHSVKSLSFGRQLTNCPGSMARTGGLSVTQDNQDNQDNTLHSINQGLPFARDHLHDVIAAPTGHGTAVSPTMSDRRPTLRAQCPSFLASASRSNAHRY